jgi:hypothetical protein
MDVSDCPKARTPEGAMSSAVFAAFTLGMNPPLPPFDFELDAWLITLDAGRAASDAALFDCGPKQYICMPEDPWICEPSFWHTEMFFEFGTNWAWALAGPRVRKTIAARPRHPERVLPASRAMSTADTIDSNVLDFMFPPFRMRVDGKGRR